MARPEKYTKEFLDNLADEFDEWWKDEKHYWLKEFAIEKGFYSQQLTEFAEKNAKFSLALKKGKEIQELRLVKKGFDKTQNCTMAIFALKNVAGWRDSENKDNGLSEPELQRLRQVAKSQIDNNS